MSAYQEIASTIWNTADKALHFTFNKTEYKDVILPFTVLKRLDTVLEPTHDKVIARFAELDGRVENLGMLTRITGYKFYNTSPFTFQKLLDNPTHLQKNFKAYLNGFSPNIQDILRKFEFERILARLAGASLVAKEDTVPVVVDDALGFTDPDRLAKMGEVFDMVGAQGQVIVLTCSPGRYDGVKGALRIDLTS